MNPGKRFAPLQPEQDAEDGSPVATWIMNALRGLPTSEDLRRTYFWDSRREVAKATELLAAEKRKSRMQRLWRVQWYCTVRMLAKNDSVDNKLAWQTVFCVIQGHRMVWWRTVADFDQGNASIGRLFLAGHAGLTNPSPLELREMASTSQGRVVCIFGSGARVTILTPSEESKAELKKVVQEATSDKQD